MTLLLVFLYIGSVINLAVSSIFLMYATGSMKETTGSAGRIVLTIMVIASALTLLGTIGVHAQL